VRRLVRGGARAAAAPCFQLVTRRGCHLCDDMARFLDAALSRRGMEYETVDVDHDPALRERFGDVVPVLLRDGVPVAKVRLDARRLERILERRR
jgi:glutaredoxin